MSKKYQCSDCLRSMTTDIQLKYLPTHTCPAHKDKVRELEEVSSIKPIPEGWRWAS